MSVSMNQAEKEAAAAMQAAAQALVRAIELSERAQYGDQIMQPLADAHRNVRFALDTAHGRN
jgi:hypothetical protein